MAETTLKIAREIAETWLAETGTKTVENLARLITEKLTPLVEAVEKTNQSDF